MGQQHFGKKESMFPAAAAAAAAAAEHHAMEPRHFPFTSDILYGLGKELVVTATKIRILYFYNRPNPQQVEVRAYVVGPTDG